MVPPCLHFFDVGTFTKPTPRGHRTTSPTKDKKTKSVNIWSSQMEISLSFIQPIKINKKPMVVIVEDAIKT